MRNPSRPQITIAVASTRKNANHDGETNVEPTDGINSHHRADHVDVAVREINQTENAVHHGVAHGNERVDRSRRKSIDELLGRIVA